MKQRCREIREIGDGLFSKRAPLVSQWQEMALNFYPERADFMVQRALGTEFAEHLITGEPALARREMANAVSSMLRPRGQTWFHAATMDDKINKDPDCKKWLEWASKIMRLFMYDSRAKFIRATKEGDNDFVTFGQCVLQCRENKDRDGYLFQSHHLRDTVWMENSELDIDHVQRRVKYPARTMLQLFGAERVHHKVAEAAVKEPNHEFELRHVILPRDEYESPYDDTRAGKRLPFVSIYLDCDNEFICEEIGQRRVNYIIPRWQTVSGSQYAHSPATVIALADARMLQKISLTLLEAGQKAVDPPMIAQADVIQGTVNSFAGGVTWVDAEYDEKLGEALRAMPMDKSGLSWGGELQNRISLLIKEAFFLNQLQMPEAGGDMTAYEVQKRFEEYMRRALPLFEPLETEYNGAICEYLFGDLLDKTPKNGGHGALGNLDDMPQLLRGQEIRFTFDSPIQQAQARQNVQAFIQASELLKLAAELDPSVRHAVKPLIALRDAFDGAQVPQTWISSDAEIAKGAKADQDAMAQAAKAQQASQGIDLLGKAGMAGQAVRGALAPAPEGKTDGMDGSAPADQQGGGMDIAAIGAKLQDLLKQNAAGPAPVSG